MEHKGIMAHFVLQETENECLLDMGHTGVQRRVYLRELVARFGHHLGITWRTSAAGRTGGSNRP